MQLTLKEQGNEKESRAEIMPNMALQRTPNTARLFAHGFAIFAQTTLCPGCH